MQIHTALRAALAMAALVLVHATSLVAQTAARKPAKPTDCDTTGLMQVYLASVAKSAVYNHADLRPLVPVVPDSNGRVMVVTLTDYTGYKVGPYAFSGDRMLWVTLVPEVQQKCRAFTGCRLLRLEQLLGLPPGNQTRMFVTISVDVHDLFRPTPDPATGKVFPCSDSSNPECGNAFPAGLYDIEHKLWIADNLLSSYQMPNGYPWTHLGYTYNWAPQGPDIYGASEYVIRGGAHVQVLSIRSIDDYCGGL